MLIREETYSREAIERDTAVLEVQDPLFLDIETTGLAWQTSHIYLLGALAREGNGWILRQWFLERPQQEKELLEVFAVYLERHAADMAVHYNGDTFDLPFLRQKYAFYHLEIPALLRTSAGGADLLRLLRPCRKMLDLSSLRQSAVQAFLHCGRDDTGTGKDLIDVYRQYLETGSDELLDRLYLHNHDDVRGLAASSPALVYARFREGESRFRSCEMAEGVFRICLEPPCPFPVPHTHETDLCTLTMQGPEAFLEIPVFRGELKHFFPDYKNYVYLPLEDEAIHRSVGMFVDSSRREPARASNCYQRASGPFLPAAPDAREPLFCASYRGTPLWFRPDSVWFNDPDAVLSYAQALIRCC